MLSIVVNAAIIGLIISLIAKSRATRIIVLLSTLVIVAAVPLFMRFFFRDFGMAQAKVTLQSSSPDGSYHVTLRELPVYLDRNFALELVNSRTGRSKEIFRSPDEGLPGSERIIWSEDSTRFLLLGTNFVTVGGATLPDGEQLYLMYDTLSGTVRCNASQQDRFVSFTTNDLTACKWLGFRP